MKREEKKKREELKKAQYEGIVKALEKKKEGAGSYGVHISCEVDVSNGAAIDSPLVVFKIGRASCRERVSSPV